MVVKLKIDISMRNGDKKQVLVQENDPKGYLIDKKTGEKREVSLTDKEVLVEYSKRIAKTIEQKNPLTFADMNNEINVINSYDLSNIAISLVNE